MTFEEALKLMREGKHIVRRVYGHRKSIGFDHPWTYMLGRTDVLATDWQNASEFDVEIDKPAGEDT